MKTRLINLSIFFLLFSCENKFNNIEEYSRYIQNEENGLSNSQKINGLVYKVSFLPNDFLKLQSKEKMNGTTFMLKISLDTAIVKHSSQDISFIGVSDFNDYVLRFHNMNFNMNEMVSISNGDINSTKIYPLINNAINTYGLGNGLGFIFVFDDKQINQVDGSEVVFDFNDLIFENGHINLSFSKKNIQKNNK